MLQIVKNSIFVETIMNNETTRNFLFQFKIQKLKFLFFMKINVKLCIVNDIFLQIYDEHNYAAEWVGSSPIEVWSSRDFLPS